MSRIFIHCHTCRAAQLTNLLVKVIQEAHTRVGKNYKRFGSDSIYLNTLVGHLKSSKVDPSNFRSWRAAVEEGRNVSETVADLTNHLIYTAALKAHSANARLKGPHGARLASLKLPAGAIRTRLLCRTAMMNRTMMRRRRTDAAAYLSVLTLLVAAEPAAGECCLHSV